eukprot:sb/3463200/
METELTGFKKNIVTEQQRNEQLTMLHNKLLMDICTVKKHVQSSVQKREVLKTEYSKFTKILQESEVHLSKATTERNVKMNQITALRQQTEREAQELQRLQECMYEYHQKGLTMDKSAQYSEKSATRTRRQAQELEFEVANVENDISLKLLEVSKLETRIKGLDEDLVHLDQDIREKNDLISHCESEAIRKNAIIERKQGQIDQFNKKIDQLNQKDGGEEVGPLELQISTLQKQLKDTGAEKEQLEQYWLKKQSHLVQLTSQAEMQWADVTKMKKQHTILQQKKIRIDKELETTSRETKEQQANIRGGGNKSRKREYLGLTMDKSAQYSEKSATRTRRQAQELEFEVANVENDIRGVGAASRMKGISNVKPAGKQAANLYFLPSLKLLEVSKLETRIKGLDEDLVHLDQDIREKNDLISHCESEAIRKNAIIERKQGQIDQFNKKIDQLNQKDGGEEVGPLELQISTLQKQLKDTGAEKEQLEQYWLKKQSHLVQLTSQAEMQWADVTKMKKQHTILQQKKIRIDKELETTSRETKEQQANIRTLQNDMTKLNVLINKKNGEKEDKEQDTILMENDFIETLKEHEQESITMQVQNMIRTEA